MVTPVAILIGPPGAGKSTVGRRLAALLDVPFDDTDAIIERRPAEAVARVEEHIRRSYTILPMGRPLSDVASRRDD